MADTTGTTTEAASTSRSTNSYQTYLMIKEGDAYKKLIDVKETPDLGQAPDTLDTTTLSDNMHTYINDILDTGGGLEFSANYTKDNFTRLKQYEHKQYGYAIWFDDGTATEPTGKLGKFSFEGDMSCWAKGTKVGAVREIGLSIAPATVIEFE